MHYQSAMHELVEHLLEKYGEEVTDATGRKRTAFKAQISFIGNTIAGGVAHSPIDGVYELLTAGALPDGSPVAISRFFSPEDILYLDVATTGGIEGSKIVLDH